MQGSSEPGQRKPSISIWLVFGLGAVLFACLAYLSPLFTSSESVEPVETAVNGAPGAPDDAQLVTPQEPQAAREIQGVQKPSESAKPAVKLEPKLGKSVPRNGGLLTRTGPTVFFRLSMPAEYGPKDLLTDLTESMPYQTKAYDPSFNEGPIWDPNSELLHKHLPWTKFSKVPSFKDRGWVEVRSRDGLLSGGAWLNQLSGVVAEPLAIQLKPSTYVEGKMVFAENEGVDWAFLTLKEKLQPGSLATPRFYRTAAEVGDTFRFDCLTPGLYELRVNDANWFPWSIDINVRPGANNVGSHLLKFRPTVGHVRGVVESTSGQYEGVCHISLSDRPFEHDALYGRSLDFRIGAGDRLYAPFEFEDVGEGPWYLYLHCHDGFDWPNSLQVVHPPQLAIRIVLDDLMATLHFDLKDADTGLGLETGSAKGAKFRWRTVGERGWNVAKGGTLDKMPTDLSSIEYEASAPGYQTEFGGGDGWVQDQSNPDSMVFRKSIALSPRLGAPFGGQRSHAVRAAAGSARTRRWGVRGKHGLQRTVLAPKGPSTRQHPRGETGLGMEFQPPRQLPLGVLFPPGPNRVLLGPRAVDRVLARTPNPSS